MVKKKKYKLGFRHIFYGMWFTFAAIMVMIMFVMHWIAGITMFIMLFAIDASIGMMLGVTHSVKILEKIAEYIGDRW